MNKQVSLKEGVFSAFSDLAEQLEISIDELVEQIIMEWIKERLEESNE